MKKRFVLLAALIVTVATIQACRDTPSGPSGQYGQINSWILSEMDFFYFWQDYIPSTLDGESEPEEWFSSMLKEDDIFSYIVDDKQALLNDLNGISYEAGYSPAFGTFTRPDGTRSDSVFIVVEFVYPDTPAEDAGLQRGDAIVAINGQELTIQNYLELYYSQGPSELTFGDYIYDEQQDRNRLIRTDSTLTVQKAVLDLDPVVYTNTYDTAGSKIGYMFYSGFRNGEDGRYRQSVDDQFAAFKAQGITDLVIDLRYNPGGTISASVNMANAIAPATNVMNEDIFVSFQYNQDYENALIAQQGPDSPNLNARFSQAAVNFGFDRIYFLTTGSTASASELIINGLEPYMDVYSIGENTFGKFYGSFVLTGDRANPVNNYAIVPVSLKYANALGVTDFRDGLEPDFPAEENIFDPFPIGDVNDPLLGTAIQHITEGVVPAKPFSARPLPYVLLPDPVELKKGNIMMKDPSLN